MQNSRKLSIGVVVALVMGMAIAHSEEPAPSKLYSWTNTKGQTLQAYFVRKEGPNVVLKKEAGAEFTYPVTRLAPASRKQAAQLAVGEDYKHREFYGAKLEPKAHVLHGAGQCESQNVVDYAKILGSYDPAIFMDYCGVKDAGAYFVNNLKKKLDEFPKYTVVQLGIGMTQDGKPDEHYEHDVAAGKYDANLSELFEGLKALDVPFYIRIGYECNGSWNGYQPKTYKKAFRHVTQMIRKSGINAATVWCPHPNILEQALEYYPGDKYVDWWAVDIFSPDQIRKCKPLIAEAHKHGKPVMIGESTPRYVGVLEGKASWDKWFGPYFELIRKSPGIKAFCYINWNWGAYPQWKDWGDARLQQNKVVADLYKKEMSLPLYQHASTKQAFRRSQLATEK